MRECPLRISGAVGHLHGEPRPVIPGRTLIYGERDSELSCILVAGIKRAFSLTTDHIPGIFPRQHIPENKCGLGHSPQSGVRLGGHIIQEDGIFNTLNYRFYVPPQTRELRSEESYNLPFLSKGNKFSGK